MFSIRNCGLKIGFGIFLLDFLPKSRVCSSNLGILICDFDMLILKTVMRIIGLNCGWVRVWTSLIVSCLAVSLFGRVM